MNIHLSGLRAREQATSRPLMETLAVLPRNALRRFKAQLRAVHVHLTNAHGAAPQLVEARVTLHRRRGEALTATARGGVPEMAVRRALARVRRTLRRADERRRARRHRT